MKRIALFIAAICYSVALMAQTPQEIKLLRERVGAFAYATQVEQVDANSCNISLSSGDNFTLCSGSDKAKFAFKSIDVNKEVITAKPHKGKPIIISCKPDQQGALLALFKATKGKKWSRKSGWGDTKRGISTWEGITCNSNGEVTHIQLKNNNLQGRIPDVFYAFPELKKLVLEENQLTGQVPRSLAWLPNKCVIDVKNNKLATTTLYVPRHRIPTVSYNIKCYPQQKECNNFRLFVDCDVDLNPVNGHYPDNHCRLHHKATEGAGINIYVVGEGFDKAEYAIGGTADYWLERAANALFDIKPFSQLKSLFNVYIVATHSQTRGVGQYDNPIESRFAYWLKKPKEIKAERPFQKQETFDACKEGVTNAGFEFKDGTVFVVMIANSTIPGGVELSRTVRDGDKKRHIRIGINTTTDRDFNALVWHEFIGHGFGYLLDEYSKGKLKIYKKKSVDRANLDTESDPKKVKWAKFIEDPRYAEEKIGVYQKARSYSNLYRATETSVMRSNRMNRRFNAPSRAEIYRRAMELAYPGWKFDYEEFVKFDMGDKYYPLDNRNKTDK